MTHYPFLLFCSVIVVPTAYWIGIVEIGVLLSQDTAWSLTFGQVSPVPFHFGRPRCNPDPPDPPRSLLFS